MDPFRVNEDEHRRLRELLAACDRAGSREGRADALAALRPAVDRHVAVMEAVWFPAVRDAGGSEGTFERAEEQHEKIEDALRALESRDAGSEAWWSAYQSFHDLLDRHLEDEARSVRAATERALDASSRAALADELASWREPGR